jgi:predicted  nucleic acid-binding Zn-ribbon protein
MPRVRYTSDGGRYRAGGVTFTPGDEHDIPQGLAEHLVEDVGDFEYVDTEEPAADNAAATSDTDSDPDPDADADAEGDGEATADEDGAATDSDAFDIEGWLDNDYGDRAETVEAGEVDAHLDTIAEHETSDTVLDAIGVRRAELAED